MTRRYHRPWIRVGGRLLVAGCLLLALLPPPLPWSRAPLLLIALVDESLSMSRGYTDGAWQQLRRLLASAPDGTRLRLIRFAASPVLEAPGGYSPAALPADMPRSAALDRSSTDIAGALQLALRMVPPDRAAVMVLVSDTAATQGHTESALQAVHRTGVPLYLLAPQAVENGEAISLQALQVPSRVNTGDRVPVVVLVASTLRGPVTVSFEIDGRVADQRVLEPGPGEPALASFSFVPQAPGVSLVTVRARQDTSAGQGGSEDAQSRAVNVLGPAPLLYVAQDPMASPVADSLRLAGWKVATATPADLAARLSLLQQAGAIILDNLAVDDLTEAAWLALVKSVQVEGKGLAVLGGPRSFGAGAYRHSTLEQILPVTAEAAEPQAPAAVVFLLDRSGSMGQEQAGPSRLSQARQAVAASANMLLPDDYLGIVAFASRAQIQLPLAPHQADSGKVLTALDVEPAGGTRLGPALQLAAEQLRAVAADQRLIVLVTDGFAGDEDLQAVARDLEDGGITVIALAVGQAPNLATLRRLTDFNQGRVLSVADTTTLPRLMTGAIATRRAPAVAAATTPVLVQTLPFALGPVSAWPPLSAYMVSKTRPTAQLYLQSSRGDPLLATGLAGAGRVAVLPAGLGSWASQWWQWPGFGAFLGGLAHWLEPDYGADNLSLAIADQPGALLFSADVQIDGEWDSDQHPTLLVDDPAGARTELAPILKAPGRYEATLPANQSGLYQATLRAGGRTLRHAVYRNPDRELHSALSAPTRRQFWLEQGWLKPWPGGDELLAAGPRDASGLRRLLLVLALLSYLLLLVLERGLAGPPARWLRARFSR